MPILLFGQIPKFRRGEKKIRARLLPGDLSLETGPFGISAFSELAFRKLALEN